MVEDEISRIPPHDVQEGQSLVSSSNDKRNGLDFQGNVDRNAQFHGLSPKERNQLECVEYQAVKFLSYAVPAYFILCHILGCLAIGTYVAYQQKGAAAMNHVNPW